MNKLLLPLRGIVPPMVTPLKDADTLDREGLERLIEHILAGGVHGLFIMGTTGEGPSLSYDLRRELIKQTCQQVNGRVPVLVGLTDTAFAELTKIGQYAGEQGAHAGVIAPPYYFKSSQPELLKFLDRVTAEIPLPVYLYNMPGCTKLSLDAQTVVKAAENPQVIGYKDSSFDLVLFHRVRLLLKDRTDFPIFLGPGELLAESVLLGASGGVNGGANMFPSLYVNLYNAAVKRDMDTVLKLHSKVIQMTSKIYTAGKYPSSTINGIKCALSLMGICDDFVSEPFLKFDDMEKQAIKNTLEELKLY